MGESGSKLSAVSIAEREQDLANGDAVGSNSDLQSELTSYLTTLGLDDAHLAKVVSLMQGTHGESGSLAEKEEHIKVEEKPLLSSATNGRHEQPGSSSDSKTIKLFLAEEQQIQLQAYQTFLKTQSNIALVGCISDTSGEAMADAVTTFEPDVLLMGVKALRPSTVERLQTLRDAHPDMAVVLLFAFYDIQGIKALREFSRDVSVGRAYLLKHTIDTVEQLAQAISSVAEGRMIVDPTVMEELIKTGDSSNGVLQDLSPRALEVLHWVSRGYRNETIAGVLSRDVKTIERHINNIYSTLLDSEDDAKHPRVRAALLYLRATGVLSTEQLMED